MSEDKGEYAARLKFVEMAERAAEATRARGAQLERDLQDATNFLVGVVTDMNVPPRPLNFWRSVLLRVSERLPGVCGHE